MYAIKKMKNLSTNKKTYFYNATTHFLFELRDLIGEIYFFPFGDLHLGVYIK